MIIGVRNDQFAWMHGMGVGVRRAILVLCVPNLRLAVGIRHARTLLQYGVGNLGR